MRAQLFKNFLIIILIGIAVYSFSWSNDFVWDDDHLIKDNHFIKSLHNWYFSFSRFLFHHLQGQSKYYRPLQEISYALDYRLWGLNPFGYHLSNSFIHISCGVMFSLILYQIFKNLFISLWGGVFFLVHPVQTEAVVYISGRADPLGTLFILLALSTYIEAKKGNKFLFPLSLFSFLLALFSRESNLVFPFVILAYNLIFLKKESLNQKLFPFLWFLMIGFLYAFIRLKLTAADSLNFYQWNMSWGIRMITELKIISQYILLLLFPYNLHMERFVPWSESFLDSGVIFSLIFILIIIYLCLKLSRKDKAVGFFALLFVITLSPFLNIIPLNAQMAEHWLYLPSTGFLAIMAWLAFKIKNHPAMEKLKIGENFIPLFLTLLLVIYSYMTIKQIQIWRDPLTFYEYTARKAPYSSRMDICLASIYSEQKRYPEATALLKKVIKKVPQYFKARHNLASVLIETGKLDEAEEELKILLKSDPENIEAHLSLADLYSKKGEDEKAVQIYRKMMETNPGFAYTYYKLGNFYYQKGKIEEARDIFKAGLSIDNNFPELHNNLGICYAEMNELNEAKKEWMKALKLDPHYQEAKYNLEKLKKDTSELEGDTDELTD